MGGESQARGKKGWCFLCRNPADYYCKDTKVPVCSATCKKKHLEMLKDSPSLNYQHSQQFRGEIEQLLLQNISKAKSPALSMDFLVAIYLYSDYLPQHSIPHHKALNLPVIYERIWLLYLSHYRQMSQTCDHIFASCLTVDSFAKQMASEYFLTLSQSPYILHVYNTYDRCG